ncbi:MAG: MBL fold metallo-hydrolase [Acidobacteriota bacterium]|nr:MBL fold metallo-hydrolase [Acidobacteriota bacterium]
MAQNMIFEVAAAPPFMTNGFVLGCPRTREGVIVDPGDCVDDLVAAAVRHGLRITRILLTHAHVDHVSGVAAAKRAFDVPVFLHKEDQFLYDAATQQGAMFGLRVEPPPPVDRHYGAGGEELGFGDFAVDVHHTPGHCPGGVCLAVGRKGEAHRDLFVGDTLFSQSIGRTDLPGGDYETLMRSIKEVLFGFPDDTPVYSGHGPSTTIGDEKRTNPFLT